MKSVFAHQKYIPNYSTSNTVSSILLTMHICQHNLYTLWANKKRSTLILFISLPIINRFSTFFSLAHSADNLQLCDYYIFHHTVNVSLHYLVKYK